MISLISLTLFSLYLYYLILLSFHSNSFCKYLFLDQKKFGFCSKIMVENVSSPLEFCSDLPLFNQEDQKNTSQRGKGLWQVSF